MKKINLHDEKGFGLFILIVIVALVLTLTGVSITLFERLPGKAADPKLGESAATASKMGLSMAITEIKNNIASQIYSDPMWPAFFQDTDINGDGIIASDGEVDINRDGMFDISIYEVFNRNGRNGIDDDGDGTIDDLPHIFYLLPPPGLDKMPEIAPTLEDANGNKKQDQRDGLLEDSYGNRLKDGINDRVDEDIGCDGRPSLLFSVQPTHPLFGLFEDKYDPVNNPDPQADDYHPLFNPEGTEGNGRFDSCEPFTDINNNGIRNTDEPFTDMNGNGMFDGETDLNDNAKLDTIENGLQKWLLHQKLIPMDTSTTGPGATHGGFWGNVSVKVIDTNSRLNLNGPDILTARLLNNLLRVIKLVPPAFSNSPESDNPLTTFLDERGDGMDSDTDSIIDDGAFIGLNSRGIEYDCSLDATIGSSTASFPNNVGTTTPRLDDSDAVLIIKHRNSLPGKRFDTVEQLLEVVRPSSPGVSIPPPCSSPQLTRNSGQIFGNEDVDRDPANEILIDNIDEFERLKEFVTVSGFEDKTSVRVMSIPPDPLRFEIEPRFPIGLNTATKEVLQAVIVTGLMEPDFSSAGMLAEGIIAHRLPAPQGKGQFKDWKGFEDFMDNIIGTDTARLGTVLLKNKARLIAQFEPDAILQDFNPNRLLVRPIDKSHIGRPLDNNRIATYTTELAIVHSGYYEVDSLGIITSRVSEGMDEFISFQLQGIKGTLTAGGEMGRKEIIATLKTMEILRHTTQKDFEDTGTASVFKSYQTKSLFHTSSYPENMRDIGALTSQGMGSALEPLSFIPTALEVDEITGNVYVGGKTDPITLKNDIGIWRYNKTENPLLRQIGTAALSGLSAGSFISVLAIDPLFASTDFGRLYAGVSNNIPDIKDIKVFDIMGTKTSSNLNPQPRKDVKGHLTSKPIKLVMDAGHKVIAAITGTNNPDLLEWRYPPGDTHSLPEIDNLNTPLNEALDGIDNDEDGFIDDTALSSKGRPETLIDIIDSDSDLEIDDSIRPKPTHAKRPNGLQKEPFIFDITTFSDLSDLARDLAFDRNLGQFFVTGTNSIVRLRDSTGTHTIERVVSTPLPSFTGLEAISLTIDTDDSLIYLLGSSTISNGTATVIKLSTIGTPTAFHELDRLSFKGLSEAGINNPKKIVMDEEDDLIFVLSGIGAGTVTAINTRNERMQIIPLSQLGTVTEMAKDICIDSRRKRVYIAEEVNPNTGRLKVFEYKVDMNMKQAWPDGQIQLSHDAYLYGTSTLLNSEGDVLYLSDFHGDLNLMATDTTNQFGTGTPILSGTGTAMLIVNGATQTASLARTIFTPPGTVTVRSGPDGVITQTLSTTGTVTGGVISYDPKMLFGPQMIGTATVNSQGLDRRGIRQGAIELWIKFPKITNPLAVPEINVTDGKDNDGDGIIDESIGPASSPEPTIDGIDNDGDGYVDDIVGIGVSLSNRPNEIILSRSFYEVQLENDIFVTKDNGIPGTATQLMKIMGTTTSITSFTFDSPVSTYTTFSKLSLKGFEDKNVDALIDNATLELERFSFPGTITVTGSFINGVPFINKPIYPGSATYNIATTTFSLAPGRWRNIAFNWWIETETTGSNTENLKQDLFIDGTSVNPVSGGNLLNIGTDTTFLLGTVSSRLSDLITGTTTPVFHIGTKIFKEGAEASFMATFDDLVIYNNTSSVSRAVDAIKRFSSTSGTYTPQKGEPYHDYNLNFKRDGSGHRFEDKNRNSLFDPGEAFDMGSSTTGFTPPYYDISGEFYSFYGEQFVDSGTGTIKNGYEAGERYIDYNRNGVWDQGELFINLPQYPDGSYTPGVMPDDAINDFNSDRRLDESGYLVRNFDTVIPAGSRIATIAWTGYLPATNTSDISFELTLNDLYGKNLWRWFGGDGPSAGTRIDLSVPEDSILEYRLNLFAIATQTESPVIDDITVTVIKKTPEIISIKER